MKLHRYPKMLGEMGNYMLVFPRSLVPSTRKGKGQEPGKVKDRKRLKLIDQPGHKEHFGQDLCYSATCCQCGKVWISAIRPIKPNTRRDGRAAYLCDFCR